MRSMLAAGLLLLGACSQPEPLRGIDLPPASLPNEIDSTQWGVAFSHEFGPDFWAEGPHVYQLLLDCPEAGDAQVESELVAFVVGPDVPTHDEMVYLRLSGLSTTTMGMPNVQFLSSEQQTTAIVTAVGLSETQVEAAQECVGEVQWDDGQAAQMEPGEPFRP